MVLRAGLIGFGTVGTGAVKTLFENKVLIQKRIGTDIHLSGVADVDWQKDRGVDLSGVPCTTDAWELIRNAEIDVMIELVGGVTIAKDFVRGALENGKDVITANKALLADSGSELFKIAADRGRKIYFEGSVGGGIPLIQSLYGGLASAKISEIHAIINGTSNYILTAMDEHGKSFDEVLTEAQKLGYAELDPTYDVEGIDAAHKLAILASICFDTSVKLSEVYTQGIRDITIKDIRFGRRLGYKLKLLAIAKDLGGEIEVRVHPTFIPENQLLASVNGVFNAVNTFAKGLGSTILYGRGAGDLPTGHAVISDLMQCAMDRLTPRAINYDNFFTVRKSMRPMSQVVAEYYLRFLVQDKPGVLAKIAGILGEHDISILSVLQTETSRESVCPIVIMTHEAREGDVMHALEHINELDVVMATPKLIRIEQMNSRNE
ncbi:MAG: homoserine dehydrogenase [Candidatus Omnitrophota bacterium]|jgi:homoserine dehydrogenase|nr:MAG: homoserine dehydrogenase [Candidatus Omnitrophota bacterium]